MNKKVISLLLMFAMALSLAVPGVTLEAKAADKVPVTVTSASGKPGDTVKVSVSFGVSETQPVRSAQFKLRYDATKLTVISAEYTSNAPKGLRLTHTETAGTVNWGWASTEAYTVGGDWIDITFQINENAAAGKVSLIFYDTLCSEDTDTPNYKLAITDGSITIQSSGSNSSNSSGSNTSGGGGGVVSPGPTGDNDSDANDSDNSITNGTGTNSAAKVTKIKFTAKKSKIKVKKTYQFKAKTIGKKVAVKWSVSNKKIGVINKKTGKFRAKKPGTVTVYAKAGGKTVKVKVKVTK